MEYLTGGLLAAAVAYFGLVVGFARERSFYASIAIVVATYYVLFAVMGGSTHALFIEIAVACAFAMVAVIGFKQSAWLLVAAIAGHGVFDLVHHDVIANAGVPRWWPGFCATFDVVFGLLLAERLVRPHPFRTS